MSFGASVLLRKDEVNFKPNCILGIIVLGLIKPESELDI